jgi:hypothetical protein
MATLEEVGVSVKRCSPRPGETYYEFAGGSVVLDQVCRCLVKVVDERGVPLPGVNVTNFWPGGSTTLVTDADGKVEFFFGPEAKFWKPNVGPHSVRITEVSDVISGMGLPEGHHADYQLLFVRKTAGSAPPPTQPPAGTRKVRGRAYILGIPIPFEAEVEDDQH